VINLQEMVVTENFLISTIHPDIACRDIRDSQEHMVSFIEWLVQFRN
jgi:hypothetical protein